MKTKDWITFLSVLTAVLLVPVLTLASYERTRYPSINIGSLETMKPNGEYVIYVSKDGKWEEAGTLAFDKFYRDREIDLNSFLSETGNDTIRIRLVQKGGGAAHIDSVFLGEKPAVEVLGVDNGVKKLSKSDFDVIDAFDKSIDVIFDNCGKSMTLRDLIFGNCKNNRTLRLTARVEAVEIGKEPFKFPKENIFREVDPTSRFYTYKLGSRSNEMRLDDGKLDEVTYWAPFFRQYFPTGSGHPQGFTYGWVWNDNENLYVAMDFTPDNTRDGDKDYAKVYVNTSNGVREFKVSEAETTWGKPGFTYTNKVAYQHKVYKFKIPFTEIEGRDVPKELSLAFAAYGTATAPIPPAFIICKSAGGSTQSFDFSMSGNAVTAFSLVDPQCRSFGDLGLGTYTVTETVPPGWELSDIACSTNDDATFNTDLQNHSVQITLDNEGDIVLCTFTNARPIPTMTEWGVIIFLILAGIGSVYYLRRQKRTES